MASLLSKFRIDYSDLTIFTGLMKKPQEETNVFYENLIKDFVHKSEDAHSEESKYAKVSSSRTYLGIIEVMWIRLRVSFSPPFPLEITISEADLSTMQDKTNRHLRLRELLLEHSQDANFIVM